jgi:hypothetical protein
MAKPRTDKDAERIEPAPKKGTAQKLLYSLQQITYVLIDNKPISILVKPASMEEGIRVKGGSTPNFKRMGRFGSMMYYYLIRDHAQYIKFRTQTLNFIREEREHGHMGIEQGCNAPHDGMHLSATMLVYLFSLSTMDEELFIESNWWLSSYLKICDACYFTGYDRIAIPGFRCKTAPLSENRDIIYQHLVLDRSIEDVRTESKGWRNKYSWQRYYLPIKLAIEVKKRDRESSRVIDLTDLPMPKLLAPMKVNRSKSKLTATISVPSQMKSDKKLNISTDEIVSKIEIDNRFLMYERENGIVETKNIKEKEV